MFSVVEYKQTLLSTMLRTTKLAATKSSAAAFFCRSPNASNARSICIASKSRNAMVSGGAKTLPLATRRPLALVTGREGWKQKRHYASSVEDTEKGVVSCSLFFPSELSTPGAVWIHTTAVCTDGKTFVQLGPKRLFSSRKYRQLHR